MTMIPPDRSLQWPVPWRAVELIARAESCRLAAYRCPAGRWTCGWGETDGVGPCTRWTQQQADERLRDGLAELAQQVLAMCSVPPGANELGALVSLAYNIGPAALRRSSVLRAHNRGDHQAAARAFGLWNKARVGGVLTVLRGLTARRAAEAALYLTPDDDAPAEPMPQAVEPESAAPASPIAQGGAVTLGAGVLAAAGQAEQQLGAVGRALAAARGIMVDTLGLAPGHVLPVLMIAAGAAVLWWRLRQRREGWA